MVMKFVFKFFKILPVIRNLLYILLILLNKITPHVLIIFNYFILKNIALYKFYLLTCNILRYS